jgi:hypothetical protein
MSEYQHTTAGLVDKRREIAGQIEHVQRELHRLVVMLDHLDFTIRMLDPGADLGPAKRYPVARQAFKGQMAQFVLGALREANGKPVTSLEIAKKVIAGRGLNADQATTILIRKRVGAALRKYEQRGIARELATTGGLKAWVLAD